MARFPPHVVDELLINCRRRCCICLRFRGRNLEIHHLQAEAEGGSGEVSNGIPVCYDCHAEIESKSNMGRKFSAEELRGHRDSWFAVVRERPEKLLADGRGLQETGPLEALMAELQFNGVTAAWHATQHPVPLENGQFRRAISVNALASLPEGAFVAVTHAYMVVNQINYLCEGLLHLREAHDEYQRKVEVIRRLGHLLVSELPKTVAKLRVALGEGEP